MRIATESPDLQFVEGLFFEDGRYFLMTGRFVDQVPECDDIVRKNVFYRLVETRRDIYLKTFDYIFRYDPDWFWNVPETGVFNLFRRHAPERWRNSAFYTKYVALKGKALGDARHSRRTHGAVDSGLGSTLAARRGADPLRRSTTSISPAGRGRPCRSRRRVNRRCTRSQPNELYFNLGCYCQVQRPDGMEPYHYTKILDRKCFELGGIKMLYSSSFLNEAEFDAIYNGAAYRTLKAKYDPGGNAQTLYKKVALAAALELAASAAPARRQTSVLTEFAMKQPTCASWCILARSLG